MSDSFQMQSVKGPAKAHLRVVCTKRTWVLLFVTLLSPVGLGQTQTQITPAITTEIVRQRYQIQLKIDFDERAYSGSERVRWVNHGDHPAPVLYFHLYSNLRTDQSAALAAASETD